MSKILYYPYARPKRRIKILFHTTLFSNLASIQKHGLCPKRANSHGIYLAMDAGQSEAYDAHFVGAEVVLLAIDLYGLDETLIGPDDVDMPDIMDQNDDDRDLCEVSWKESLKVSGQIIYTGTIKPKFISVVKKWVSK